MQGRRSSLQASKPIPHRSAGSPDSSCRGAGRRSQRADRFRTKALAARTGSRSESRKRTDSAPERWQVGPHGQTALKISTVGQNTDGGARTVAHLSNADRLCARRDRFGFQTSDRKIDGPLLHKRVDLALIHADSMNRRFLKFRSCEITMAESSIS